MFNKLYRLHHRRDDVRVCTEARYPDQVCPRYADGWITKIDETTPRGFFQGDYIRHKSGRRFFEDMEGALTVFYFYPGQRCFGHAGATPVISIKGDKRIVEFERFSDDWNETTYRAQQNG